MQYGKQKNITSISSLKSEKSVLNVEGAIFEFLNLLVCHGCVTEKATLMMMSFCDDLDKKGDLITCTILISG